VSGTIIVSAAKKALGWLAKRSRKVSKHVSLHQSAAARQPTRPWLLNKAVHTVFRGSNPRKLIRKVLRDYDRAVVQAARGYGRQGYVVLEKAFDRAVGRNGERILRVVINPSTGKIVTAFPAREFAIDAFGVAALAATDLIVDAVVEVDSTIARMLAAKEAEEEARPFTYKAVEFLIDVLVDPGVANENEDIMLAVAQIHGRRLQELIAVSEAEECLSPDGVQALKDEYYDAMAGITSPYPES
jgi:hypothetical protein